MTTLYNQIAGQSLGRLASLSDGIFAVAMTLLVLDLRAPAAAGIRTEHDLCDRADFIVASGHHVCHELHDPGNILGRPANPA